MLPIRGTSTMQNAHTAVAVSSSRRLRSWLRATREGRHRTNSKHRGPQDHHAGGFPGISASASSQAMQCVTLDLLTSHGRTFGEPALPAHDRHTPRLTARGPTPEGECGSHPRKRGFGPVLRAIAPRRIPFRAPSPSGVRRRPGRACGPAR
jgi:hypothetical protein